MNIIITGASKGIGKAIAEQFAAAGHTLFLCSRNEKQLYDMVALLQTTYPDCTIKARPADMAKPAEAKAFGTWCLGYGVPDIVVNNAGQFLPGSVNDEKEGTLEQMIEVNLYSALPLNKNCITKDDGN